MGLWYTWTVDVISTYFSLAVSLIAHLVFLVAATASPLASTLCLARRSQNSEERLKHGWLVGFGWRTISSWDQVLMGDLVSHCVPRVRIWGRLTNSEAEPSLVGISPQIPDIEGRCPTPRAACFPTMKHKTYCVSCPTHFRRVPTKLLLFSCSLQLKSTKFLWNHFSPFHFIHGNFPNHSDLVTILHLV